MIRTPPEDHPDPDLVARILAELVGIPRGPIDPDLEPPLPMDGEDDGQR